MIKDSKNLRIFIFLMILELFLSKQRGEGQNYHSGLKSRLSLFEVYYSVRKKLLKKYNLFK